MHFRTVYDNKNLKVGLLILGLLAESLSARLPL